MSQTPCRYFAPGIAARIVPGPGDKVLWIHGYTMDSSTWHALWQQLPGWHHIGIDLPGHGASEPWSSFRTIAELARLIGAQAMEQGVRHIIGLSFGGMLAVQIAIEFPSEFATFTLGSPALLGGPQAPLARERYRDLTDLYRRRGAGPWMTEVWMQSPPDIFKGAAAQPTLWRQLAEVIDHYTWQELHDGMLSGSAGQPQRQTAADLQRVTTPTLVLIGDGEMPAFTATAAIIQGAIPHCACLTLPGAGHLCMLELPVDAGALIAAHLQSPGALGNPRPTQSRQVGALY
jgi:pimeloyl-ACP methyl ester carboxylesterase